MKTKILREWIHARRQCKLLRKKNERMLRWYPVMTGIWISDKAKLRPRGRG